MVVNVVAIWKIYLAKPAGIARSYTIFMAYAEFPHKTDSLTRQIEVLSQNAEAGSSELKNDIPPTQQAKTSGEAEDFLSR